MAPQGGVARVCARCPTFPRVEGASWLRLALFLSSAMRSIDRQRPARDAKLARARERELKRHRLRPGLFGLSRRHQA